MWALGETSVTFKGHRRKGTIRKQLCFSWNKKTTFIEEVKT